MEIIMDWNLQTPKVFHVYWGGGPMSYIRFMTVKTFMRHNPDWKVMIWYPKHSNTTMSWWSHEQKYDITCKDFFPELMELPIDKCSVDFEDFGFKNDMSEVHKSDFIRLHLLSTIGGVWSDLDIFYIKPMSTLYFNSITNKNIETFYCDHRYGHSIGFMIASQGNKWFKKLMEIAKKEYNPLQYQALGAVIYNKYFNTFEAVNSITPAINMSMDVVYPHDASNIESILDTNTPKFTDETIGLHWYAGSPIWKDFMNRTNGGLDNLPNNVIGNLLKNERDNISSGNVL